MEFTGWKGLSAKLSLSRFRFRRSSMEHPSGKPTAQNALELQLLGYRLATAEIIYRMPDHREIL